MRAVVFNRELKFEANHPEPRPGDGECLVRVHLAGICSTDLHITRGYMSFSGVLGHEMVGTVVDGSSTWQGRRVVCEINCVCRTCDMCVAGLSPHCRRRTVIGIDGRDGCFADLLAVPERNLHAVPDGLSDEEAVFVEPLAAAYQVLAQCRIGPRMNVSVVGPGRLGLLVAQVLKTTGCTLTAVGRNRKKLLLCEKKGIQAIHVDDLVPRQDRDAVVDCTGSPEGLELAMKLVRPRGTIVLKSTYALPGERSGRTAACHDSRRARDAPYKSEPRPSGSGYKRDRVSANTANENETAGASPDRGRDARTLLNLAPIVVSEINLVGSRCGPFPEAINALARQAVEVRSLISKTFPIEKAAEAFQAAQDPDNVKVLLRINPG